KRPHIGALLIEFAVAIPVLIAVLYYLHDIPKHKRMKAKMNFCAHCMVNILQNMSQKRANKKINLRDIGRAAAAVFLTIYPGKTMYDNSSRVAFGGHFMHGFVCAVKGLDDGKASVLWFMEFHTASAKTAESVHVKTMQQHISSTIKYQKNVDASSIHKDLVVAPNEIKILVECFCMASSPRKAFGYWVLTPAGLANGYYNSVVIFTPKAGIFGESLS
ncbi:MAG: hypothetical protein LBJ71_05395, partial [Holosporaceae bacterium]|nr:hypothetical protein [Holosporaceae bacterium]